MSSANRTQNFLFFSRQSVRKSKNKCLKRVASTVANTIAYNYKFSAVAASGFIQPDTTKAPPDGGNLPRFFFFTLTHSSRPVSTFHRRSVGDRARCASAAPSSNSYQKPTTVPFFLGIQSTSPTAVPLALSLVVAFRFSPRLISTISSSPSPA